MGGGEVGGGVEILGGVSNTIVEGPCNSIPTRIAHQRLHKVFVYSFGTMRPHDVLCGSSTILSQAPP